MGLLVRVGDRVGAQQTLPSGAFVGRQVLLTLGGVGQIDELVHIADVGEEPVGPTGVGA